MNMRLAAGPLLDVCVYGESLLSHYRFRVDRLVFDAAAGRPAKWTSLAGR